MTCIYTGAHVRFPQYGTTVPADLYAIGSAVLIRYLPSAWNRFTCDACDVPTHTVIMPGETFHRPELGITVVPREAFNRAPERQPEEEVTA